MALKRTDVHYKNIYHEECVDCMIFLSETLTYSKDKNEKEVLMLVRSIYNKKDIDENIKKLKKMFKTGKVPNLDDDLGMKNAIHSVITYILKEGGR